MSSLNERLISWAQNEEMVNVGFTEHGIDCIAAAEVMEKQSAEIERLRGLLREYLASPLDRAPDLGGSAAMIDLEFRTGNAIDQLLRYASAVETEELCDVLEAITDINDDLAHGRSPECVNESIDKAIAILQRMRPIR